MGKKEPVTVATILESLERGGKLGKAFTDARIWERWPEVVGMKLMPYGRPLGVRNDTLLVEVVSSVWMHRYAYRKAGIIRNVNRMAGVKLIDDVFFVLADPDGRDEAQDAG